MKIKAKVTIATIYTIYSDGTESDTNAFMYLGNPSKADIKTKYLSAMSNIKKATVCEVERKAVDIEINSENADKTFTELLETALDANDIHVVASII